MRWVPNAAEFMDDQMDIFEQKGMNHAVWDWEPIWPELAAENDEFNFLNGPDPNNHTDVSSSALIDIILKYWGRNTIRPSDLATPDIPVEERILSITSAEASPGADVTVQINIDDAAGIAGLDVLIEYDPDLITVFDVKASDLVSGMSLNVNTDLEGKIIVGMAGIEAIASGSGPLMDIELSVSDDAQVGDEATLQFTEAEIYDIAAVSMPVDAKNGVVKITEHISELAVSMREDTSLASWMKSVFITEP